MTAGEATPLPAEPLRRASRLCAAAAIAIGLAVIAGWVFGVPFLMQVLPGQVAMVPNTAVGLLLAGLALWLRAGPGGRTAVLACRAAAALAGLLGLLNLVEYVSGSSLGIDELLFRDPAGLTSVFPGRMAVLTAVSFVALAAALLTLDLRWPPWTSDALALLPGVLAMVSLSGYTYGLRSLGWIGIYKGMAIHTALAFLVLTFGVLLVHARGVSRLLVSDTAGGVVARRILPVALLAPFILGWLRIAGQERGLYGQQLGRALYAVADSLILIAILLGTAAALMRADEKRRSTEEALRTAEEQYRLLFENSPQPMWVVDRETLRYLAANDAAVEHYGYSRDEFLSMHVGQLRPAEDFAAVQRAIPNVNAGLEKHGLWRHLKKDGTLIHVDIATHTLTFKGRSAWLVLAYDVTDRLRAVETLRKLSRAVEQSPVSVVITDTHGAIEYVNPKFTRVTGYSSAEVLGLNPRILKSGELSPEVYREMWKTITAGGEWRGELHNRKKDGELFWEFASISPILDEEGKITHFIAIKEDITGRKLLETQLRASQKMEGIGRLAGGIAHDFNNLLTAILGLLGVDGGAASGRRETPVLAPRDPPRQRARRGAHPSAPRVQPPAGPSARASRSQRGRLGGGKAAAQAHRRGRPAGDPARSSARKRQGRSRAARAGAHEPRGQRPGRHARGRHAHDRDRERRARRPLHPGEPGRTLGRIRGPHGRRHGDRDER